MEEFESQGCKIKFYIDKTEDGYIGKGTVYYREKNEMHKGKISGSVKKDEKAAREDLMKKFRNFVQVGLAKHFPNKDILD